MKVEYSEGHLPLVLSEILATHHLRWADSVMLSLRGFTLVLTTVLVQHFASFASVTTIAGRDDLRGMIAYCVVFCVLGKVAAAAAALKAPAVSSAVAWRSFEARRSQLEWLWVGSLPWAFTLSGWSDRMAQAQQAGWSDALLLAVWFLPSLIFMLALDLSAAQLEEDLTSTARRSARIGLGRLWLNRVRLGTTGSLVMCLGPVFFVLGLMDGVQAAFPSLSTLGQACLSALALGFVSLTIMPIWMRYWIGAKPVPVDFPLAARVTSMCAEVGLRCPAVMSIAGSPAWYGAAVVGWTAWGRQLWIGEALLKVLGEQELDMVLLHELAHVRRGHPWWRLCALLGCGGIAVVGLASTSTVDFACLEGAWMIGLACACAGALGWISRRCELDADAQACELAGRTCAWAVDRPDRAAIVLQAALARLHSEETNRRSWFWLHPSLAHRTESLAARFTTHVALEC